MILNFKEIYKSANDNINGNKKVIDKLFEKKTASKTYKIPAICSMAAAVAIVVTALTYTYRDLPIEQENSVVVYDTNLAKISETHEETAKAFTEDDGYAVNDSFGEVYTDTEDNIAFRTKGGGASKAAMEDSVEDETLQVLSEAEYLRYLGIGENFDLSLPDNVVINKPQEYVIKKSSNGSAVTDDSAEFFITFSDNGSKSIVFTVGKTNPKKCLGNLHITACGVRVNMLEIPNGLCADLDYNGVWVYAKAQGIGTEEFSKLLSDILSKICQ